MFNEIISKHETRTQAPLSPLGKLQVVRAVGVTIVMEGAMFPTMELLLRHAIQYVPSRSSICCSGPLVLPVLADPVLTFWR